MLMEVQSFCRRAESDLPRLINELQEETGRVGQDEYYAWSASLSSAARVLDSPVLREFHLHLGQRGGIAVEYRLPASASWCDLVLLGRGIDQPVAVIVELKHWDTYGDTAGPTEALVVHHGELLLHPSDQVRGYADYCRRFHSTVVEWNAEVSGCVYFTVPQSGRPFLGPPHESLVADYPVFADTAYQPDERFAPHLANKLRRPDFEFARAFERGTYRQHRGFCDQIAKQIAAPGESPFVLLDHQRQALELCRAAIDEAISSSDGRKMIVLIEGPPGSGKSVVAARLWAELRRDTRLSEHDAVITTTSASQRRNWERLFERTRKGASGVVMPANRFAPADLRWVKSYTDRHGKNAIRPERWRENIGVCKAAKGRLGPTDAPLVSIVDEAHALINPEHRKSRPGRAGWPHGFGPQAWHIIRASRVAIFLMDRAQSFRDRESTSPEDIERWATEQGAHIAPRVSLAGLQFRLAGSVEYTKWVDFLFGFEAAAPAAGVWRTPATAATGKVVFEIERDPLALEEQLRIRIAAGDTARLVAAYGRDWLTNPSKKDAPRWPHDLPSERKDFDITFERDGQRHRWTRIWNHLLLGDYSFFIQALPGSRMASDPLCEVGCPYVVRGFDFDWIGLLWLRDLVWRQDRWVVDLDHVYESGVQGTLDEARRERKNGIEGPGYRELLRRTQQAYRILLTRAMKGIYVWFEDQETAEHVRRLLR
jgi:hypothetical protein